MKIPIKKFDHPRPALLDRMATGEEFRGTYECEAAKYAIALEAHHKEETAWLISEIQRLVYKVEGAYCPECNCWMWPHDTHQLSDGLL